MSVHIALLIERLTFSQVPSLVSEVKIGLLHTLQAVPVSCYGNGAKVALFSLEIYIVLELLEKSLLTSVYTSFKLLKIFCFKVQFLSL